MFRSGYGDPCTYAYAALSRGFNMKVQVAKWGGCCDEDAGIRAGEEGDGKGDYGCGVGVCCIRVRGYLRLLGWGWWSN